MDLIEKMVGQHPDFKSAVFNLGMEGKRAYRINFSLRPATTKAREIVYDMEFKSSFLELDVGMEEAARRFLEVKERALLKCLKAAYPEEPTEPWWKFWRRA